MPKLTKESIEKLAREWYDGLDVHAPMLSLIPMLSGDGDLEMKFPEATLKGLAAFEGWYQGVIRIFFDEVHTVKEVNSEIGGDDTARVKVVVRWEASRWVPPARYSDRIKLDAYQTWTVKYSDKVQAPVIVTYSVDELKYTDDSARL
ncbi:MAG: nuclear transport factor 2 family protein [Deltaproteobacteria bacterium]|nr:nuclear transport factor 2 family protein [Deltaproteobacteria bacterium]